VSQLGEFPGEWCQVEIAAHYDRPILSAGVFDQPVNVVDLSLGFEWISDVDACNRKRLVLVHKERPDGERAFSFCFHDPGFDPRPFREDGGTISATRVEENVRVQRLKLSEQCCSVG
jgi:hypothetical protein